MKLLRTTANYGCAGDKPELGSAFDQAVGNRGGSEMHSRRAKGIVWAIVALVAMSIGGVTSAQGKTRARITSNTVYADPGRGSNESNDITVGYDAGAGELIITDRLAGVTAQA